jgi:hypothetical protein
MDTDDMRFFLVGESREAVGTSSPEGWEKVRSVKVPLLVFSARFVQECRREEAAAHMTGEHLKPFQGIGHVLAVAGSYGHLGRGSGRGLLPAHHSVW